MTSRKVFFHGAAGAQLVARLDVPTADATTAYAVLAHCFTCSKDSKAVGHISRTLNRSAIAVLRLDFTGLGESEGEFAETSFASNIDDLVAAADFLAREYEAPKLLVGHSLGGAAVIQAARRIPSAVAVATIGAPYSPAHLARLFDSSRDEIERAGEAGVTIEGRPFRITRQLLEDLEQTRVDEGIRSLGRALLLFHSPADEIVSIDHAARIYTAAQHPKSFVSLDRADHLLSDERDARYVGDVLAAWVSKYVGVVDISGDTRGEGDGAVVARIGRTGYRTDIMASGHALVADEPVAAGGTNEGPTPYDLLVAALGTCTAMTLRMYADRKQWPLEEVVVRLKHGRIHAQDEKDCESRPARVDQVQRELELVGALDDAQRERLREIADKCPVHRTLEAGVKIHTELASRGTSVDSTSRQS